MVYDDDLNDFNPYLGDKSLPCCIKEPIVNHIELIRLNSFTSTSGSSVHGWGLSHSYGLNLKTPKQFILSLVIFQ